MASLKERPSRNTTEDQKMKDKGQKRQAIITKKALVIQRRDKLASNQLAVQKGALARTSSRTRH